MGCLGFLWGIVLSFLLPVALGKLAAREIWVLPFALARSWLWSVTT
jgi:hypothetical protein